MGDAGHKAPEFLKDKLKRFAPVRLFVSFSFVPEVCLRVRIAFEQHKQLT